MLRTTQISVKSMKKVLLLVVAMFAILSVNAQSNEKYYGTREGGFAITFNANPLINFVGNMFNGTQNNRIEDFNGLKNDLFGGVTMTGKYFLKDNIALDLGFGFDNEYKRTNAYNDSKDNEKVSSWERKSSTSFMAKAGINYLLRPGKRLQPILGADLVYVHKNNFTYGKDEQNNKDAYESTPSNALGLLGSVGVEYFIIKQISVGATVDFGVAKVWNREHEDVDGGDNYSRISDTDTKIKTGNFGGNLSLNFYF